MFPMRAHRKGVCPRCPAVHCITYTVLMYTVLSGWRLLAFGILHRSSDALWWAWCLRWSANFRELSASGWAMRLGVELGVRYLPIPWWRIYTDQCDERQALPSLISLVIFWRGFVQRAITAACTLWIWIGRLLRSSR